MVHADDAVVDDDACVEGRLFCIVLLLGEVELVVSEYVGSDVFVADLFRASFLALLRAAFHLLNSLRSHAVEADLFGNVFGLFFFGR